MLGSPAKTMFRKPPPPPPPPEPPRPARRFTDTTEGHTTFLGAGLRLVGDLKGGDSVVLGGVLEGNVAVEGLCHVRERARMSGAIRARQVLLEGEVEGRSIVADEKVELRSQAKVRADIQAASIAIAEGSFFEGQILMRTGGAGHLSFQEKRKRPDRPSEE